MELTIKNISKQYSNGVKALDDVSFTVSSGLFGLLGPNGAGKTTLMKTLATLLTPDSGEAFFNGRSIFEDLNKFRSTLGYLPQEFGFHPKIKAIDLLDHVALMKGMSNRAHRKAEVSKMLENLNLTDKAHHALGSFSGGMKQRFGLALTLISDPKLIIVDEPTTGLDPMERNRLYNLLSQLAQERIVIISTHIVEDINRLCQKFAILRDGKLLMVNDLQNIRKEYTDKIWEKKILSADLEYYQDNFSVLSTQFDTGNPIIRVLRSDQPDDGFNQSEASLEDVYFHLIKAS